MHSEPLTRNRPILNSIDMNLFFIFIELLLICGMNSSVISSGSFYLRIDQNNYKTGGFVLINWAVSFPIYLYVANCTSHVHVHLETSIERIKELLLYCRKFALFDGAAFKSSANPELIKLIAKPKF